MHRCSVPNCDRKHLAKGYCQYHYHRQYHSLSLEPETRTAEQRFWRFVDKSSNPNGCWVWTGGLTHGGYGSFALVSGKKTVRAHRYAWQLIRGPIPEGALLRHSCDNPRCVNPAHLVPGTDADNMADMVARERIGNATLTNAAVMEARQLVLAGEAIPALAKRFGVSSGAMRNAVYGRTFKHIPLLVRGVRGHGPVPI